MQFKVLREHQGDKPYAKGDVREAQERDVKHLIKSGVLKKMAEPAKNKADKPVQNKAQ